MFDILHRLQWFLSLEDDKGVLGGGGWKHPEGFGFSSFSCPLPLLPPISSLSFSCLKDWRLPGAGNWTDAQLKSDEKPIVLSGFDRIQSEKTQEPLVLIKLILENFDSDELVASARIFLPQDVKRLGGSRQGPQEARAGPEVALATAKLQTPREAGREFGTWERLKPGPARAPGIGVEEAEGSPGRGGRGQLQGWAGPRAGGRRRARGSQVEDFSRLRAQSAGQAWAVPARLCAREASREGGRIRRAGFATRSSKGPALNWASVSLSIKWVW